MVEISDEISDEISRADLAFIIRFSLLKLNVRGRRIPDEDKDRIVRQIIEQMQLSNWRVVKGPQRFSLQHWPSPERKE